MPASEPAPDLAVRQPYPGLRPFQTSEAALFFGREGHTSELLRRLSEHRFLAVVGSSGSGKSSLVRAGLLPALYRGRLIGATSRWRICVMRPGSAPLDNLAKVLAAERVGSSVVAEARERIGASSLGLARAVRESSLAEGESVLLVVDQFEELFRFAKERKSEDGGAEARFFVASLLEATDASTAPLYVVLTMRSDFLGDCTQFAGLPDALNRSQYLIPLLTREQVRASIEKPARLVGAQMNRRLVERLLNELGDDASDLPVLQHVLNRTYLEFVKSGAAGEIQVTHYLDAGTLDGALDKHADSLLRDLSEAAQPWTEKIFRALTEEEGTRKIRRATRLDRLYEIAGASEPAAEALIREVISAYAAPENSLLVHSPDGVVDISHESLISRWSKLKLWADEESKTANWYLRAVADTIRYRADEAGTWRNPELDRALKNIGNGTWNQAWADRLPGARGLYPVVKLFLERGDAEQRKELAEKEEQQAAALAAANALAASERLLKRGAEERAEAERRAKENAQSRADAEEHAKKAAESLAKTRRRTNWLLAASLSLVALLALFLYSEFQRNKRLSNALLVGQGNLQAKLGEAAKTRINPKDGLRYVFIPPGTFRMGCSVGDSECFSNENPAHDVKISNGFWLGQTDVTQGAWKKVMGGTNPSNFKGDQLPVETVTWSDAANYCNATGGRLPAEAEWEYGARGGSTSARYGELDAIAWYDKNSNGTTHAVGGKQPNQFGLFDMLGNVWEWTSDWYGEKYYSEQQEADPRGPSEGQARVVRGGSWVNLSLFARASIRDRFEPSRQSSSLGFRCVGELR
jgi:formylglycine-generating enzyme required for sulfatase activity